MLRPWNRSRPAWAEADELALDIAREGTAELERIAFAAAVDSSQAEERRSDGTTASRSPLVTLGDPESPQRRYLLPPADGGGGARAWGADPFLSFPEWPFPLAAIRGAAVFPSLEGAWSARDPSRLDRRCIRRSGSRDAQPGVPVIAVLHQPPGGIDHGPVRTRAQAPLDRLALRRASLLIAASDHLVEQLLDAGFTRSRIRSRPPGTDVAAPPHGPVPDLRHGRRAAFLTVANWLPRKGC